MRALAMAELARWSGGSWQDDAAVELPGLTRVCIDSREAAAGDLFVCLRGERFDAHDFAAEAYGRGCAALLVERVLPLQLPQLLCGDAQRALGRIAAGLAAERRTRLVGVTGSNGKTTIKTFLLGILQRVGPAYANPGNFNNEVGLPLSLLQQPEHAEFGIYEMGAGAPGDIAELCAIARPDVSLVNNVGPAHLERMGSLLGVARTKGAIYEALPSTGIAVINADDAFAPLFAGLAGARAILRYGIDSSADLRASRIELRADAVEATLHSPEGTATLALPLAGRHNLMNALAAAALATALEVPLRDIVDGLAAARGVAGRLTLCRTAEGALLIDDSYNANPASMGAAIDALRMRGERPRLLVLGDMRELGADAQALHAEVGSSARAAGIEVLLGVGDSTAHACRAFGSDARHFDSQQALIEALRDLLLPGAVALVKGSRGSRMDRVVDAVAAAEPDTEATANHAA